MSRIIGEAKFDTKQGKWYFVLYEENGDIIFESDHVFDSQEAAERMLIKALRGLANEFPPESSQGSAPKPFTP